MKRKCRKHAFSLVILVGLCSIVPRELSAQVPTLAGPNNSPSVAFWFLGNGILSCCSGQQNLYFAQSVLYMTPAYVDPTATIIWSTDSPTRLSISTSSDRKSAIITATGQSAFGAGYDVHVTVSFNGIASSPFPIFLNAPFTMSTSNDVTTYTCQELGFPANYVGYGNVVNHSVADLPGYTLTPIDAKESLEKQQWLNSTYAGGRYPVASPWSWRDWTGNAFQDMFSVCASTPSPLNPQPSSYNPNGLSKVFNETQKFWIGTQTDFNGVCVQRGIVTLYSDHGKLLPYTSPITNKADCNTGQVIN